jgi:mannosyltransferase OCH1-like enzyme
MRIPRIIHFIWAGGDDKMPRRYADSVHIWKRQNPRFKIWLWIDKRSASSEASWNTMLSNFKQNLPDITLKDIEDCEDPDDGNIRMADEYIR